MFKMVYHDGWYGFEDCCELSIFEINSDKFFYIEKYSGVEGSFINRGFYSLEEAIGAINIITSMNEVYQ